MTDTNTWETVIGLEIHAQLATKSKIFSGSATAYGAPPNTQASLVDLAYPGVLPVLNAEAVRMAVKFGLSINAEVARQLSKTFGIRNHIGRIVGIDVPGYGPIPESLVKLQIVGVIRSERTAALNAPPELVAYLPLAQAPRQDIKLVVRTRSEPAPLPGQVSLHIDRLMPIMPPPALP